MAALRSCVGLPRRRKGLSPSCTAPTKRKPFRGSVLIKRCSSPESPIAVRAALRRVVKCSIGHAAPIPDGVDEVDVFTHYTSPISNQAVEQVKNLWCVPRHRIRAPTQFALFRVKCVILEEIAQAAIPSRGPLCSPRQDEE